MTEVDAMLKRVRCTLDWSQDVMGMQMGMGRIEVNKVENGKSKLSEEFQNNLKEIIVKEKIDLGTFHMQKGTIIYGRYSEKTTNMVLL